MEIPIYTNQIINHQSPERTCFFTGCIPVFGESNSGAKRGASRELGPRGAWVAGQARDGKNHGKIFFFRVILVT